MIISYSNQTIFDVNGFSGTRSITFWKKISDTSNPGDTAPSDVLKIKFPPCLAKYNLPAHPLKEVAFSSNSIYLTSGC